VPTSPSEPRAGYLGFVAHEFRNPLATALLCAELLARIPPGERGGARGEKLVSLSLRALRRASAIVEDHLLAERLGAGGIPLRAEAVPLREALAAAGERSAGAGPLALAVPDGASVLADRWLLGQLLEALLGAAGREGAPVRAEVRAEGGALWLSLAGAPVAPWALEVPQKGAPARGLPRPLGLVMAAAAARALGLSLQVEGETLLLTFLGPLA
jgi:signal transduction histidine kinase